MKFQARNTIMGMKASKGKMDNGNEFDSAKMYSLVDMDASKGTAKGQAVAEHNIGKAEEFDKFKHLPFPFDADVDFEIVTNGSTQKTVVTKVVPVARSQPPKV